MIKHCAVHVVAFRKARILEAMEAKEEGRKKLKYSHELFIFPSSALLECIFNMHHKPLCYQNYEKITRIGKPAKKKGIWMREEAEQPSGYSCEIILSI